jgi:hypothetical protein
MLTALLAPLLPLLRKLWPQLLGGLAVVLLTLGLLHYRSAYRDQVALRAADKAAYVAAQEQARQKAEQAKAATEASYKALADQKDKDYATEIADARTAADAYIASHRLQPQGAQGAGSRSAAPPRVAIPAFAKDCPPMVSWFPNKTCKPAPARQPTR